MTRRGEVPITLTSADEAHGTIGIIWDAIAALAKDKNLLTVCIVSAIGLAFTLALAMAPRGTSKSLDLFAQAGGG
jgi:hypothetical protein